MIVDTAVQTAPVAPSDDATRPPVRPDVLGALAVGVGVAVAALLPLLFNPWFYFYADTPEGAYGQWYALGEKVLSGRWPLLEIDAWRAGNWLAEGQWGLWNPVIIAIGVLVYLSPNAIVVSSIVKIVFLAVGGAGTFVLIRHFGGSRGWAAVGGVAAPFAGFTLFMDATSWVTNLETWALFSWVFWAAHRHTRGRRSPLILFVLGYLLVTIGYVQGTVMLILLFVALLAESALRRDLGGARRALSSGAVLGLVALAVYLPGLLTAPVTARASTIGNDAFMVYNFTAVATGSNPAALGDLTGWWGRFPTVPYTYLAWFLPLTVLVSVRRLRRFLPLWSSVVVFLALALAYSMAPSVAGPIQFPSRTVPWCALAIIVFACLALSRARAPRAGRSWIALVLILGATTYLALAQVPTSWRVILPFSTATLVALLVARWLLVRERNDADRRKTTAFLLLTTIGVLAGQSVCYADNLHSRVDFPDDVSVYKNAMPWGSGDGFVVGAVPSTTASGLRESLVGNFWYLNPTRMANLYSPVQFGAYSRDLCMIHDGTTCDGALETLMSIDETTGVRVADLLSVDTIQIGVSAARTLDDLVELTPPDGWSVAEVGENSVTWVRVGEQTDPGGIAWASPGVSAEALLIDDQRLEISVGSVPSGGGTIVLSRLAWPGYAASGAAIADPTRGYLLTLDVPASAAGTTIVVTFQPPGWNIVVGSLVAAALGAIALSVISAVSARRQTRRRLGA